MCDLEALAEYERKWHERMGGDKTLALREGLGYLLALLARETGLSFREVLDYIRGGLVVAGLFNVSYSGGGNVS